MFGIKNILKLNHTRVVPCKNLKQEEERERKINEYNFAKLANFTNASPAATLVLSLRKKHCNYTSNIAPIYGINNHKNK